VKPRIAIVVQRYGEEVVGGAELHCRVLAERLLPWFDVDVLTSCALDYLTWENHYPAGTTTLNGVTVRRFASARQRHPDLNRWWARWSVRKRSPPDEENAWLEEQGPVVPELAAALADERDRYSAFVFFTYLYWPTVVGLRLVANRAVLFPTANPGDPPLRLGIFRDVFSLPKAIAYCTDEERDFVHRTFGNSSVRHDVIGVGFDPLISDDPDRFARRHGITRPYLLFLGRIGASKGCDTLIEYFQAYLKAGGNDFDLVLGGTLELELPASPRIRHVGVVGEPDKADAFCGAAAVVCPSRLDSLSMLTCEVWSAARPVLVTAESPVISSLCARAQGGAVYGCEADFIQQLGRLAADQDWATACGRSGFRFIQAHYSWEIVLGKMRRLIEAAAA
jgi:glycosyltransferase involved in cell wall biosynthesis